jgi:CRISPR system Cascade subunit CasE
MYLSRLKLNPRSRQVMAEVANAYEMHRTLMRAFPGQQEGGPGRVLFRLEEDRHKGSLVVLVQSEKKPDWSFLQSNPQYLDSASGDSCASKEFAPQLVAGQRLCFRLRANPTVKRNGKRLGLKKGEDQIQWLNRKASEGGFRILACRILPRGLREQGRSYGNTGLQVLTLFAALYEGILEVADPERFMNTLASGVGSGKGLGFGLLSLAPCHTSVPAEAT